MRVFRPGCVVDTSGGDGGSGDDGDCRERLRRFVFPPLLLLLLLRLLLLLLLMLLLLLLLSLSPYKTRIKPGIGFHFI